MKKLVPRSEFKDLIDHPGSAAVLGVNDEKQVLLIKYEKQDIPYPAYEIPGGVVEAQETPEQTARRELEEETGYSFDLADFYRLITPSVGYSNEWISVFRAQVVPLSTEAEFEPDFFTKDEVSNLIEQGQIIDAQSLAALSTWLTEAHPGKIKKPDVLFLCTGNYYRSRFCELYFNHLNRQNGLRAASYGLWAHRKINPGFISPYAVDYMKYHAVPLGHIRLPEQIEERHFKNSCKIIALDELEHRPMMEEMFPEWADQIEYWQVHDIEFTEPAIALNSLKESVEKLSQLLSR